MIVDVERQLLGAALTSSSAAARVTRELSAEHFRDEKHQAVFLALVNCEEQTVTAVLDRLERDGKPVDGVDLHTIVASAPPVASAGVVGQLVVQVSNAARRRRIYEAATRIGEAAKDMTVPEDRLTGLAVDALVRAHVGYEQQAGIVHPRDTFSTLDGLYEGKREHSAVATGWKTLDRHYMPAKGRWTLVTGVPGHGKSAFLDALAVNLAREHDWRFAVCSPENQPLEEHEAALLSVWAGQPFDPGPTERMSRHMMEEGKRWLDDHFTFVMPDEQGRTVDTILALSRLVHQLRPLDGLIIDPWNELDHSRPQNMREDEFISQCLTRIRSFARQHQVHVWLVAHPTKLRKQDDGLYPVPTPYDVSGAAHWRNKADNAIAVWRDHGRPERGVELHVQKVRFQRLGEGTEGMVRFRFDRPSGRYFGMADGGDDRRFV